MEGETPSIRTMSPRTVAGRRLPPLTRFQNHQRIPAVIGRESVVMLLFFPWR
jgi:hypothetical protein